jgi:GNAT superfamily N-acetyltransferase
MTSTPHDALVRMAHLNFVEFNRQSARASGEKGRIDERDGIVLYATGTTFPAVCNGVYRLGGSLSGEEVIQRATQWFGRLDRGFTVWVSHHDDHDVDLAQASEAAGLLAILDEPEMICTAPVTVPATPEGVELRWVTTAEEIERFGLLNGSAYAVYGMPPETVPEMIVEPAAMIEPHLHTVMAWQDDQPVASAQLFMSQGVAGVYWVGTLEAARGQGLGELVTAAVTNRGFELGAPAVTLQASPMGEPIYARMGYETAYRYTGWVHFPS